MSNEMREMLQIVKMTQDYLQGQRQAGREAVTVSRECYDLLAGLDSEEGIGITLEQLYEEAASCRKCPLHETRTNVVFGVGNPEAKLVFVGEAPGHDEDLQGEPFVGRAGQLLTRIIESINLRREEVYIANILKCRPPGNRNPTKAEMEACEPYLTRQLMVIRPRIVCTLGNVATQKLLQTSQSIGRLRGRFHPYRNAKLMPTYHPAALLRNPNLKRDVWEDIQKVQAEYNQL